MPLVTLSGHAVGALCLVDYGPRELTGDEVHALRVLARQVVAQLELRRHLGDVRARVAELQEIDRLRNRFVNMVVHEFRNPLAVIRGYGELLRSGRQGPLSEQQVRALTAIDVGADQLLALVDELLRTASLLDGDIRLDPARTELVGLVREAVARAEAYAGDKIVFRIEAPRLAVVSADARRLGETLDHLLSNAVKYTPDGGTVSVAVLVDKRITLKVADTGIGIPEDELGSLFTPFFRASTATGSGIAGTGLGLCTVKAIIDAHDGDVRAESVLGKGTTISIELPQNGNAAGAAPKRSTTLAQTSAAHPTLNRR